MLFSSIARVDRYQSSREELDAACWNLLTTSAGSGFCATESHDRESGDAPALVLGRAFPELVPGLMPGLLIIFLEEVPCMLDSSFQPGPAEVGTDFRAESILWCAPFALPCGEDEALKGGNDASEKVALAVFLICVAMFASNMLQKQ